MENIVEFVNGLVISDLQIQNRSDTTHHHGRKALLIDEQQSLVVAKKTVLNKEGKEMDVPVAIYYPTRQRQDGAPSRFLTSEETRACQNILWDILDSASTQDAEDAEEMGRPSTRKTAPVQV